MTDRPRICVSIAVAFDFVLIRIYTYGGLWQTVVANGKGVTDPCLSFGAFTGTTHSQLTNAVELCIYAIA